MKLLEVVVSLEVLLLLLRWFGYVERDESPLNLELQTSFHTSSLYFSEDYIGFRIELNNVDTIYYMV